MRRYQPFETVDVAVNDPGECGVWHSRVDVLVVVFRLQTSGQAAGQHVDKVPLTLVPYDGRGVRQRALDPQSLVDEDSQRLQSTRGASVEPVHQSFGPAVMPREAAGGIEPLRIGNARQHHQWVQ